MDIQALSEMNNTLTNHLNSMKNNNVSSNNHNKTANNINNNSKQKSGIVIARKGDSGYIQQMDADEDGEISLEEFNKYCEENGVSEDEKMRMLSMMQTAKTNSKVLAKATENKKSEDKEDANKDVQTDDKAIYAKKGDDKYNEVMDTNKNGVVTYQEYMEYCNKRAKSKENDNSSESKETKAYVQNEHYDEEPEMTVEAEA